MSNEKKEYTRHVVLHFDIIIKARNKAEAERIFNEITLANPRYVAEGSEIVSEVSEWQIIKKKVKPMKVQFT